MPGRRAAAAVLSLLEASSRCLVLDTAAPKARVVRRVEGSFREDALGRRYFPAYPCAGQPLFGWRVLVPRTKEQAGSLTARLRGYGAVPDEVPTSRLPTEEELRLIREVIDPEGAREREVPTPA